MEFDIQAPEKSTYKFNEVTSITGVKPYVLRFWESEFDQIDPKMNDHGQKFYGPDDLEMVQKIKTLLFENKLSIPEAKKQLLIELEKVRVQHENTSEIKAFNPPTLQSKSSELKTALEQIIETHSNPSSEMSVKADSVVQKVKSDLIGQSELSDRDIVKLVSAKKKLTVLLGKIDNIADKHNW